MHFFSRCHKASLESEFQQGPVLMHNPMIPVLSNQEGPDRGDILCSLNIRKPNRPHSGHSLNNNIIGRLKGLDNRSRCATNNTNRPIGTLLCNNNGPRPTNVGHRIKSSSRDLPFAGTEE